MEIVLTGTDLASVYTLRSQELKNRLGGFFYTKSFLLGVTAKMMDLQNERRCRKLEHLKAWDEVAFKNFHFNSKTRRSGYLSSSVSCLGKAFQTYYKMKSISNIADHKARNTMQAASARMNTFS